MCGFPACSIFGIGRIEALLVILGGLLGYIWLFRSSPSPLHNIPGPRAKSWVTGNLYQLFDKNGLSFHEGLVETFGAVVKVYGFFGEEQLYISDPQALQAIFNNHQDSFDETSIFLESNKVVFGPGLVATTGEQHKRQRKLTIPVFSVAQLRESTPIFYEVAERLVSALEAEVAFDSVNVLDMASWMSRAALESLGQTLLGYSFDPLDSCSTNPYTSAIRGLIPALFSLSILRQFAPFLARVGSPAFRRMLVEWTPIPLVRKVMHMSDIMYDTAKEILEEKSQATEEPQGTRSRDIISALMLANAKASDDEKMSESELIGQITVLIFGGQDTTSSALSRILFMLATHQNVQTRVRQELQDAFGSGGRLGYEDIIRIPYLDSVIKETLRLYPPVLYVRRTAVKDCILQLSRPIVKTDMSQPPTSFVCVPKGTTVTVGLGAANRLKSVWGDDANEWKPERWLNSNLEKTRGVPSNLRLPSIYGGMTTFLAGNRSCIGYQFAQLEMKILLAVLLMKFKFTNTQDEVVWNLSQIISPSVVRKAASEGQEPLEEQGLPMKVELVT